MIRLSAYKARAARAARFVAYLNGRGPQYKVAENVNLRGAIRAPLSRVEVYIPKPRPIEEPPVSVVSVVTPKTWSFLLSVAQDTFAKDYILLRGRCTRASIAR